MPAERVPWKLQVVAYLALFSGVSGVIKFFLALSAHSFYLPFDALGIPICFGLLHYRAGWRTLTLVLIAVTLVLMPVIIGIGLFSAPITYFEFLGIHINLPRALFFIISIFVYLLIIWQYRVLKDPEIKRLFR